MKNLLIAILMLTASSTFAGFFEKDSTNLRPRLLVKTSALSLYNWRAEMSFVDIGAEFHIHQGLSIAGDIGKYYRSGWSGQPEFSNGFYSDASLRYYPQFGHGRRYYMALQYRYQRKRSLQELDFTDAGLPYRKMINVNRNSKFGFLMIGSNTSYFSDRLYLDFSVGIGVEHRFSDLQGLASFEQDAVETGEVVGVKYDEAGGRFLPAYHFEVKLGFRIF